VHYAHSEIDYAVVLRHAGNSIGPGSRIVVAQARARYARRLTAKALRSLRTFFIGFPAVCDGVVDHSQAERKAKRLGDCC
jgi:hypothetical protein